MPTEPRSSGSGVQSSDSFDNRTVTCGDGPTISVAGQQFPTSITATAAQLRTGAPVEARVCGLDASATLPAGQPEVVVEPGPAFSVDNLDLTAVGPSATQRNTPLESTSWTANHRELTVTNSSADQLIVNPESTSIGWIATAPDGSELTPVVVNGWQQGWIVPAGTAGTVTIDFPSDRWYRLGIFGGLVLLIPLLFAALVPTRREPKSLTPPRPWRSVAAGWVGVLAAATVIGGGVGAAIAVVCSILGLAALRIFGPARTARILVGTAGVAAMIGITLLSTGPWRAPGGYVGDSFAIPVLDVGGLGRDRVGRVALCRFTDMAALLPARHRDARRFLHQGVTGRGHSDAQDDRQRQDVEEAARERNYAEHGEHSVQYGQVPDEQAVGPASDCQRQRARQESMLRLIAQHQWRDQRKTDDRAECNLDRVLPRLRPHQTFGPGQIGARENEGHKRNKSQEHPPVREAMYPRRRAHGQLGQHHARRRTTAGSPAASCRGEWRPESGSE